MAAKVVVRRCDVIVFNPKVKYTGDRGLVKCFYVPCMEAAAASALLVVLPANKQKAGP